MARDGFFTGLDIGTSSIKVLVAEHVNGEMNVIGVSNAKSAGVKDGIIVDIEAASNAIKTAIIPTIIVFIIFLLPFRISIYIINFATLKNKIDTT